MFGNPKQANRVSAQKYCCHQNYHKIEQHEFKSLTINLVHAIATNSRPSQQTSTLSSPPPPFPFQKKSHKNLLKLPMTPCPQTSTTAPKHNQSSMPTYVLLTLNRMKNLSAVAITARIGSAILVPREALWSYGAICVTALNLQGSCSLSRKAGSPFIKIAQQREVCGDQHNAACPSPQGTIIKARPSCHGCHLRQALPLICLPANKLWFRVAWSHRRAMWAFLLHASISAQIERFPHWDSGRLCAPVILCLCLDLG